MINKYLNKIILGDGLEILKQLPNKSIDMILVDPPYFKNMKLSGKSEVIRNLSAMKRLQNINSDITPDMWFKEALRVLKTPNIIIWLDMRHQAKAYLDLIYEYELKFYDGKWWKPNPTPLNNTYLKDCESWFYIYKSPIDYETNYEYRKTITILPKKSDKNNSKDFIMVGDHPTPKPFTLIEKQILKHSKKGNIVLDFFSGTATTAIACKLNDINFIAVELNEEYYNHSVNRLNKLGSQLKFDFDF